MTIEVPRLPLEPGEAITMPQLFKHIGTTLVEQGILPSEFSTDDWAERAASNFVSSYGQTLSTLQTEIDDKKV